ncbi:DUF2716 domain-containing protein [Paenibacillus sp. Leaf72]|uniref:DUF2716 domain-containing protein n=1 Tax=Paenibacillus sp. Leaf72 TaxID=1736234 RepID=UPI0006FA89AC|nr:DUF2716 domain-containing protein [Paenibacillus sp. Leaf72]KQN98941.1 sugar epimerase [Paenibacillus sp. Leaf72]
MGNWIELDSELYRVVWDKFSKDFNFKPGGLKENSPTFITPRPFVIYDISHLYGNGFEFRYKDLEKCIVNAMLECTDEYEYIYVLDWQHDSYLFNPHLESTKNEWGEWPIPLYPNGDYYFFLNKTMTWGYLGHPWENSICIFGNEFLKAVERIKPKLFNKVIRQG